MWAIPLISHVREQRTLTISRKNVAMRKVENGLWLIAGALTVVAAVVVG